MIPIGVVARLATTLGLIAAGLVASPVSGSAAFGHAWTLTISKPCVLPGAGQSLTVSMGAPVAVVNLVVKYSNGAVAQSVTLEKTAADDLTYRWTVASNAPAGETV